MSEYRKIIDQLQRNIKRSGENLRNWFKLFDDNNDDFMELEEFAKLLKQINVVVKQQDLAKVFELMDLQERGRISYNDFCDVIEKDITLPYDKIVRKRRRERGEAIDAKDSDKEYEFGKTQNIKSVFAEIGTGSQQVDLGSVDGMSAIMHRSEVGFEGGRQLI